MAYSICPNIVKKCVTCGYFVGEREVSAGKTTVRYPSTEYGECCYGPTSKRVVNSGSGCSHYQKWVVLK